MRNTALAATLLLASTANAAEGDWWLNAHLGSWHSGEGYYDKTYDWKDKGEPNNDNAYNLYNESNFGLGVIYEYHELVDFRAGAYKNSVYNTSVYAGGSYHSSFSNIISVGAMFGLVTGYEPQTGVPITIMVMPYISINTKYVRLEVNALPGPGNLDTIVGMSAAFRF